MVLCVQVPPKNILLTPVQCKSLWRQFKSETEYTVTQAISAQVILQIYLRLMCDKHNLVNGMFSLLFFRRLTSEVTTGFHRLGRLSWWLSLVSMNSWCFWSNIYFLALLYYTFKILPKCFSYLDVLACFILLEQESFVPLGFLRGVFTLQSLMGAAWHSEGISTWRGKLLLSFHCSKYYYF